ncbi:receptor-transporting protein 3 isoform X2 [Eulemur rufifrons]|uniref:receptor-transporting protein 3 isoform X2 n=1 Tax=Eulemur rufifrons TaxID=859984 RepID=UPI003741EB8A
MAPDTEVWKQVFQELIQEVKPWHRWSLTSDKGLFPNVLKPRWMQYQQWAFARFQCSSCSRSWASAQVQVLFHMHWSEEKSRGQVKMRVFAQRCKKCSRPPFEVPEFTQENISRILNNLVFRILKKCYREVFKSMEEIPMIKEISLEGPHNSDNCEACLQGFCAGPTQEMSLPTSWIPRANTTCQVEREVEICPSSEHFYSYTPRNHSHRNISISCCFLLLIVVVVVIVVKTVGALKT